MCGCGVGVECGVWVVVIVRVWGVGGCECVMVEVVVRGWVEVVVSGWIMGRSPAHI